jgi:hypothetical protein
MPIPENINREHIIQAIQEIHREGIPPRQQPRQWAVLYEGEIYPCKLLISWANIFANGEVLDINPNNFNTYMARDYLEKKGFNILDLRQ